MMRLQLEALRETNPKARLEQQWVPYGRISNNLKRAVIASEDANFADHDGVDWDALEKAYERNNRRHKVGGPAARPSPSSWPRTCSCPVPATTCARGRN
jgi:monofunctional biosynthetic peptidoglycan transglycosylase